MQVAISGFMNMHIYKLVIFFVSFYGFLGRQHLGSVKVQAKLKCNARGFYTIPNASVASSFAAIGVPLWPVAIFPS